MSFDKTGLNDYVDVAARIAEFRNKHPDGSLQPADLANPFTVVTIGPDLFIAVTAAAYRTPDDLRPGIGMAYEPYPGKTNFTRGSELQNAETSAWGRAIVAVLAADTKRGIASAEDVRNRGAEHELFEDATPAPRRQRIVEPVVEPTTITNPQMRKMQALFGKAEIEDPQAKRDYAAEVIGHPLDSATQLTVIEADRVIARLENYLNRAQPPADAGVTP